MPLDTQPLSRTRRILMHLVLLALLAASLAFAQTLVLRKQKNNEKPFLTTNLTPFGFTLHAQLSLPDQIDARIGVVGGHPRRVDIFAWQTDDSAPDLDALTESATDRFTEIMNTPPQEIVTANLAGIPAVEAHGSADNNRFALLRLAALADHIIAISYSGPLPFTDADKTKFNALCATGLRLNK